MIHAPQTSPRPPHPEQILEFIEQSGAPAGKREIAKAFNLSGHDKIMLKSLLKDMADEGLIDSAPGRAFHKAGGVPRVTVLRMVSVDDGQVWAQPESWHADTPAPKLRVIEKGRRSALALNDRILARTEDAGRGHVAHIMKKLERGADLVLGVVRREGDRFFLTPVDKRERRELLISEMLAPRAPAIWCWPSPRADRRASPRGSMRCSAIRSRRAVSR